MSSSIDAYLDAVDLALLKAGASRAHRQGILKDLEAHIRETLAERAKGREPTEGDISAVLATLGDPSAYANGVVRPPAAPGTPRRLPSQVKWGALLAFVGWIAALILMGFAANMRRPDPSESLLLMIAGTPVVIAVALSTVLGWLGWRQITQAPSVFWGRFFAALEMLTFPLMLLIAAPLLCIAILFSLMLFQVWRRMSGWHPGLSRYFATS
jgi:hypothetical protein